MHLVEIEESKRGNYGRVCPLMKCRILHIGCKPGRRTSAVRLRPPPVLRAPDPTATRSEKWKGPSRLRSKVRGLMPEVRIKSYPPPSSACLAGNDTGARVH